MWLPTSFIIILLLRPVNPVSTAADGYVEMDGSFSEVGSRTAGSLRPSQLPGPILYQEFYDTNEMEMGNRTVVVKKGKVQQVNYVVATDESSRTAPLLTEFDILQGVVERETIENLLRILRSIEKLDEDPDTVDGMPTYEIFVDSPDLGDSSIKYLDSDPEALKVRNPIREKLRAIMKPILEERITPYVRSVYPACATGNGRNCTPCYSLVRRYRHGERQSHDMHNDGHAIATVVICLNDYGTDYRGGLYIGTGYGQRQFIELNKGDAAVHQSNLLHGVKVYDILDRRSDTERWSWILWYRDSETCEDFGHEWFADCAKKGDAICLELHSTKVTQIPGLSQDQQLEMLVDLNHRAADGGSGRSAVKMARCYLKTLSSNLPYDEEKARKFYEMAIKSHHPDGYYGLAQLLIKQISEAERRGVAKKKWKQDTLQEAIKLLEEGALLGHTYAMFNLGIAHTFGYGIPGNQIDTNLAREWYLASGLPEGYYVASFQAASVGDAMKQKEYDHRARVLGFYAPWRKMAREKTGSGGASGVDLNMQWPKAFDGRLPPSF